MTEVPLQVGLMKGESTFFSNEKAQLFKQYYGASPELVEGSKYFGNSES